MTEPTTPTDDELSLALDGEADADLLARIAASPGAQARLEELRAASALVAGPVEPLADDEVDQLVSTAIDTPVAPARVASAGGRRAAPWLVAAAVILLMATGLSLVWAGRGDKDDQASASKSGSSAELQTSEDDAEADSAFSEAADSAGGADAPIAGGHGTQTTLAAANDVDLPLVYLGTYASADALREATATSFADALEASDGNANYGAEIGTTTRTTDAAPSDKAVDRCAEQLQITLSLEAGPLQEGFATVDGEDVLVYEFGATSARNGKQTTLVAAVGTEACNEVVIFER